MPKYSDLIDTYRSIAEKGLVRAQYKEKSIVEVPKTFLKKCGIKSDCVNKELLDALDKENIIFIIIDAVGFSIFARYILRKDTFSELLRESSYIDMLTSTIPSTTVTALTSLYTGEYPGEHGIIGYKMYVPEVGAVINVLSYSPIICSERECLKNAGMKVSLFLNESTIFNKLKEADVSSYVLTYEGHIGSVFTSKISEGAQVIGDISLIDAITLIPRLIRRNRKTLIYTYIGTIDSLSHRYGPYSQHVRLGVETVFFLVKSLIKKAKRKNANIVITADHGQIKIRNENVYYFTELCNNPKISWIVPPFGEKRFAYLFIGDEDKKIYYKECLDGKFMVWKSSRLLDENFFGPIRNRKDILSRIGDTVIIGLENNLLVYPYRNDDLKFELKGHHGGLSPEEMIVPLIVF